MKWSVIQNAAKGMMGALVLMCMSGCNTAQGPVSAIPAPEEREDIGSNPLIVMYVFPKSGDKKRTENDVLKGYVLKFRLQAENMGLKKKSPGYKGRKTGRP
ncbi:MAG: hypothetical protein JKY91_01405 [Emcibacter sp.]|nr:hypothetical protein [Emcibacter sp.]MBL4894966.1 hypothetical protein [Emcibacter sp.]